MDTIQLQTESYLFKSQQGFVRAIPLFELAYNEFVVYEDGKPAYFIDCNDKQSTVVTRLEEQATQGTLIEDIIKSMGKEVNRN